jgi:sugar O-acyltransferase (sialic acid O-acetyltransferase NeuD family)
VIEIAQIVDRINGVAPTWELRGCISDSAKQPPDADFPIPIVGDEKLLKNDVDTWFVFDEWFTRPAVSPVRNATLVDPSAIVDRTSSIGPGSVVYPNVFIGARARLGGGVFVLSGAIINHDADIGERVVIASGATLAGSVTVGNRAYLGQGCQVRQHTRIGTSSVVGMGAVVIADVAAESTVVGNPARVLYATLGERPDTN